MKTNQTISISRDFGIDWVKAIAITLVIFTHCFWSPSERTMIIFPFLVELGVPLFTLVTGYNYYNSLKKNDRNTLQWYFKYGSRILIPFAIAMVIEVFYMTLVLHYPVKRMIFIIATGAAYARFKKQLAEKREFLLSVCFLVIGIICIYILNYSGIKPVIFKQ